MLNITCKTRPLICSSQSIEIRQQSLGISLRSYRCLLVTRLFTRNFSSIFANENDAEFLADLHKDTPKDSVSSAGPLDVKQGSKKTVPIYIDIFEIGKAKNMVFKEQIQESVYFEMALLINAIADFIVQDLEEKFISGSGPGYFEF